MTNSTRVTPGRIAEDLNRVVKLALDSGEAATIAEALAIFSQYRLQLVFGRGLSSGAQAALLTAAATSSRCFLGGIAFAGPDAPLLVPWQPPGRSRAPRTLHAAMQGLGAVPVTAPDPTVPAILFGEASFVGSIGVRATFDGWTSAVVPLSDDPLSERGNCTTAGALSGTWAVAEVFQRVRGAHPLACERGVGLSLWLPGTDWREAPPGPTLERLPSRLWLVGLGNLGQAYLWHLGLLPYSRNQLDLVLQDFDRVARSNVSTSLLTRTCDVGKFKTRVLAAWADARGFATKLIERPFAANFSVDADEPGVGLIGVDNANARKMIERVGFTRIVEAGLGKGVAEYLGMTIHTFPASRPAHLCWDAQEQPDGPVGEQIAYRRLREKTGDRCGVLQLAARSIATPFTGAVAAGLAISEVLRLCHGGARVEFCSLHLAHPERRVCIAGEPWPVYNPGLVAID